MSTTKITKHQTQVAATAFLSLFSLVGIMFYGLPFFYDFWIEEFGWGVLVSPGDLLANTFQKSFRQYLLNRIDTASA